MDQINDSDVWHRLPTEYLWIYDKLIVARKQGIIAGPAGILPPKPDFYIVRPITNIRMMGRGAKKVFLENDRDIPDGYFWSEVLEGEITPAVEYSFEQYAKKGFHKAFRDEEKQSDVYWLAWEVTRRSGETVKPFGIEFIETLKSVVRPYGTISAATNVDYATIPEIRQGAAMIAVDIWQSRQQTASGGISPDFQPSPYRMGNTLLARIRGLIANHLSPNGLVG